ncbi:MAG: helix-turn-helix domain-containing protein, partial [Lactobacillus delbrueckii]
MNLSPRSFLKQLRINKAKKKLFNTEASIGQIAKEVGFLNQFNFTRSFKNSL